jgi:hypothetical protein
MEPTPRPAGRYIRDAATGECIRADDTGDPAPTPAPSAKPPVKKDK